MHRADEALADAMAVVDRAMRPNVRGIGSTAVSIPGSWAVRTRVVGSSGAYLKRYGFIGPPLLCNGPSVLVCNVAATASLNDTSTEDKRKRQAVDHRQMTPAQDKTAAKDKTG